MSTLEDRLDFFVGAYFKINPMELVEMRNKDIVKSVICKCSDKAYQDLKRRVPYKYSTQKLKEMKKINIEEWKIYCDSKEKFNKEISEIIIAHLVVKTSDSLLMIDTKKLNPIDMIEEVIKCAKQYRMLFDDTFSVGLAQKWVNMTIKYLWLLGVLDDEYDENLDVPIDRYILEEIAKLGIDVKDIKWSSWNDLDEYNKIQTSIKQVVLEEYGDTAIKWENEKWIKAICSKENG